MVFIIEANQVWRAHPNGGNCRSRFDESRIVRKYDGGRQPEPSSGRRIISGRFEQKLEASPGIEPGCKDLQSSA
jgi:hypothetical protein